MYTNNKTLKLPYSIYDGGVTLEVKGYTDNLQYHKEDNEYWKVLQ